ncbi:hypothetical protein SD340_004246 [Vibrio fluvialis]|nr:hypothetical protein [Vibrio fluvialis]ELU8402333.1 hypothetical protein [Vibrio fluvialis]
MEIKDAYLLDERSIVGAYKADNLTDPDSIYARKVEVIQSLSMPVRFMKIGLGFYLFLTVLLSLLNIFMGISFGVILGIFVIPMHFWFKSRIDKKTKLFESATEKYCLELGIDPV